MLGLTGEVFRIGWFGRASLDKGRGALIDAVTHLADLHISVSIHREVIAAHDGARARSPVGAV